MALSRVNLHQQSFTTDTAGADTTTAFSPANNTLLVVLAYFVAASDDASEGTTLTIADSVGLTWTSREATTTSPGWSYGIRVWTAPVVTGASMTVSIDCGATTTDIKRVEVYEYTDYDIGTPIGATAIGSDADGAGAASITLSSVPATTSEVLSMVGFVLNSSTAGTVTPGADQTELFDTSLIAGSSFGHCQTQARSGSVSTSIDWANLEATGDTSGAVMLALEIRQGGTPTPAGRITDQGGLQDDGTDGFLTELRGQWFSPELIIESWFDEDLIPAADTGSANDIAAVGNLSITGAADLDASGALIATGALSITGNADLDATGALIAAGTLSITGAADLDATGALVAVGSLAITGTADLDAIGTLVATGALSIAGAADLDASGALAAVGALSITGTADLTSAADNELTAVGTLSISGAADLNATGTLATVGTLEIVGLADLTGTSANDIAASGSLSITGVADLDAVGSLVAAGLLSITGIATLDDGVEDTAVSRGFGGADAPGQRKRHVLNRDRGFDEETARKKREEDEALTEEIRALYRKVALGEEPELAARVEAIVETITSVPAAITPNQPRKKRSVELRAAKIKLEKIEADAEIALRMAEQEFNAKRKFRAEYMRRIEIILQAL